MTNKYMFFCEQQFENFDLSDYQKNDISIPKTNIHIYEFKCKETEEAFDDGSKAIKLDDLTRRLEKDFTDQFITVNSESSQFFCSLLYPLIVDFETKLRYAFYISRSLYESGTVNVKSFFIDMGKESKTIEDADFGDIYQFVFTDKDFNLNVKKAVNEKAMTKSDFIKTIKSLDESTMWQNWVGNDYSFIEENFLYIKSFRNDVMHNHLIDFERYEKAKKMIKKANDTLDRAINDKLIVNDSKFLNDVNIFETLSDEYKSMGAFSNLSAIEEAAKTRTSSFISALNDLAAIAWASVPSDLSVVAAAAKASTSSFNGALSDIAATARASVPSDLSAMAAAANLTNEYSDNGSKSASAIMAKELENNNSSTTQQNDDENSKNPSDMDDNPND